MKDNDRPLSEPVRIQRDATPPRDKWGRLISPWDDAYYQANSGHA